MADSSPSHLGEHSKEGARKADADLAAGSSRSRSRERSKESAHRADADTGKRSRSRERLKSPPAKQSNDQKEQDIKTPNEQVDLEVEILQVIGKRLTADKVRPTTIHKNISIHWEEMYKEGLSREERIEYFKKYIQPENRTFLEPPKLNPEVKASLQKPVVSSDSRLTLKQENVSVCLSALGAILSSLIKKEKVNNVQIIERISDSCRMLIDLQRRIAYSKVIDIVEY